MKLYDDNGLKLQGYTFLERVVALDSLDWERTLSRYTDTSLVLGPDTADFFVLKFYQNNEIQYIYTGDSEEVYTAFSEDRFKIDVRGLVEEHFQIGRGQFRLVGNFYQRLFNKNTTFVVTEINSDRTELRVELAYSDNSDDNSAFRNWSDSADVSKGDIVQENVVLWFNASYECMVVSWKRDKYGKSNSTILKLSKPLPDDLDSGDVANIYKQKMLPFVTDINVQLQEEVEENVNVLRQPSFRYNYSELPQAATVDYKSENLLLGAATGSVTQSIKNTIISESLGGARLNVDYRDYNNFVCFSSATERLKNFKLKLQQIEYYQSQSDFVSTQLEGLSNGAASSSVEFLQNKALYDTKINDVKVNFDGYEKYLYYESHSAEEDRNILDTFDNKLDTNYVSYFNATWPKTNSTKPYTLASVDSAESTTWYTRQLATASLHDTNNPHELKELLPDHIKLDENNSDYLLFTDMIGHHFDEIYTYIKHIGKIHNRDESLYEGMSKDLIYSAAKSMGWTLQPGFDLAELWEYVNGTDTSGSHIPETEIESFYDDLLLRVAYTNDDGSFTFKDTSKYARRHVAKTSNTTTEFFNEGAKTNHLNEAGVTGNAAVFAEDSGSVHAYAVDTNIQEYNDTWIDSGSFAVSFWAKLNNLTDSDYKTVIDTTTMRDPDGDGNGERVNGFIVSFKPDDKQVILHITKNDGSTETTSTQDIPFSVSSDDQFLEGQLTSSLSHFVIQVNREENHGVAGAPGAHYDMYINGRLRAKEIIISDNYSEQSLSPNQFENAASRSLWKWGDVQGVNFPGQGIKIGERNNNPYELFNTSSTGVSYPFDGVLDDIRVYNRILVSSSVSNLRPSVINELYTQPHRYKGNTSFGPTKETPNLEDVDKQIWKRIVNNLPQMLKSKGTKRAVQQYLSCYGIPKTLMNIQEFGGSAPVDGQDFQELTIHNYGIHMSGSAHIGLGRNANESDNVDGISTDAMPRTIQLRFKSFSQSGQLTPQSLIQGVNKWGVLLQPSGTGSYGSLKFYLADQDSDPVVSASVDGLPIFDGDWWNMQLSTDVPVTAGNIDVVYTLRCAKSGDHEDNQITHSGSATLTVNGSGGGLAEDYNDGFLQAMSDSYYGLGYVSGLYLPSYTSTWAGHFTTGSGWNYSTDTPDMNFSGSLQEYREYAEEISEDVFHRHTMAPTAYFGNHYTSSYNTLTRRFTLGSDGNVYNHGKSDIANIHISSSHPNQSFSSSYFYNSTSAKSYATFRNFRFEDDTDGNYKESVEEHYISVPNSIGNKRSDRKIRNLDTYSDGFLSPNKTHDSSSLDFVGKDSNIVQVALSPTDNTDLDIAYQFGENRVDDFVGDPRDRYRTTYPQLNGLRREYFKKYSTQPNIYEFSKILNYFNRGFFRQLENLLPARAVKRVGLIIKPNSLERAKVQGQPQILYYSTSPSSQSFDSTGIRQRDEYRENFTFEATIPDTTASFISGIQPDKTFAIPRDNDYSTADVYRTNVQLTNKGSYKNGSYVSQSFWRTGTTASIADFSLMDSRAVRSFDGVRDFAPTESQLRHRLGRYEKLSAGVASSYYLGSKMTAGDFNEDARFGTERQNSIDAGPIVSFILIKTNQLIVKERSGDGSLTVR